MHATMYIPDGGGVVAAGVVDGVGVDVGIVDGGIVGVGIVDAGGVGVGIVGGGVVAVKREKEREAESNDACQSCQVLCIEMQKFD